MNMNNYSNMVYLNTHNHFSNVLNENVFAKVILKEEPGALITYRDNSNTVIFPQALDSLRNLKILWIDEAGNPVDFNNADHSFTLEFIYYTNELETNNYDTSMGFTDKTSYPQMLGKCDF